MIGALGVSERLETAHDQVYLDAGVDASILCEACEPHALTEWFRPVNVQGDVVMWVAELCLGEVHRERVLSAQPYCAMLIG